MIFGFDLFVCLFVLFCFFFSFCFWRMQLRMKEDELRKSAKWPHHVHR